MVRGVEAALCIQESTSSVSSKAHYKLTPAKTVAAFVLFAMSSRRVERIKDEEPAKNCQTAAHDVYRAGNIMMMMMTMMRNIING